MHVSLTFSARWRHHGVISLLLCCLSFSCGVVLAAQRGPAKVPGRILRLDDFDIFHAHFSHSVAAAFQQDAFWGGKRHDHDVSSCFISGWGMAISKNDSHHFVARAATEKSAKDQPRRGSVRFFPWSKFGPFQVYCIFGNRHASWRRRFAIYKRLRANSRDIDSMLSTRASSPINSLAFCSIMQPGVGRGFRLLGADLGCPICVCSTAPSEAAVLPPSWRQDLGLGGGPCIMQDTPNSHLAVERRDPLRGICKGVAWAGD